MLIRADYSLYLLPSFLAFFENCCGFYSFSRSTTRISPHLFLCFSRFIHIYCRTCFSILRPRSSSLRLLESCLKSICLFLVFMNRFFIRLFLCRCLQTFRYRSFKNIKKYALIIKVFPFSLKILRFWHLIYKHHRSFFLSLNLSKSHHNFLFCFPRSV